MTSISRGIFGAVLIFSILFSSFSFGGSEVFSVADAAEKKPKSASSQKPKIQCSMQVKETKKGEKAVVSWDCKNSTGWSCDLSLRGENKKNTKKNISLPKGSYEMTLQKGSLGHSGGTKYECSYKYSYRGWDRYCGSVPDTTLRYNSAYNEYQMKCVSQEGKIKRFSKGYWK